MKYLIFIVILLNSCTSYIDVPKNNLNNNYVVFDYNNTQNNFKYINKVNASADHDVYYTTNFSISLPKKIINWSIVDNNFFFEYDSKQLIYVYSFYKNEGEESDNWIEFEINPSEIDKILNTYWQKRNYNENYLLNNHSERISKLYSNGKYKILFYNIKAQNFSVFNKSLKTFSVNK